MVKLPESMERKSHSLADMHVGDHAWFTFDTMQISADGDCYLIGPRTPNGVAGEMFVRHTERGYEVHVPRGTTFVRGTWNPHNPPFVPMVPVDVIEFYTDGRW